VCFMYEQTHLLFTRHGAPTDKKLIGGMLALGSLLKLRNTQCEGFSKIVGVSMYFTGAERRFFEFVNHAGLSCSYDTVVNMLKQKESPLEAVKTLLREYTAYYILFL